MTNIYNIHEALVKALLTFIKALVITHKSFINGALVENGMFKLSVTNSCVSLTVEYCRRLFGPL